MKFEKCVYIYIYMRVYTHTYFRVMCVLINGGNK